MKSKFIIKRSILALMLAMVMVVSVMLTSCTGTEVTAGNSVEVTQSMDSAAMSYETAEYDDDDVRTDYNNSETSTIIFNGDEIEFTGNNAIVNGSTITIVSSGVYSLRGSLDDGQVVVDTQDEGTVFLVLNGVDMYSSSSAPIYIANADKTVITLVEGTENNLSDGTNQIFADIEDQEPNAVLFSEDDPTINGSGSLTIDGNYKHGINCKDDLLIIGGNITVNAVSDGIRGRDSITISDGNITISADNDGMQSNNDQDEEKGYVLIEGGTIDIVSENDGIQAETNLTVANGNINILAGGGTQNIVIDEEVSEQEKDSQIVIKETESTKGIKTGVSLMIIGGNITVDSHDDALHSNDSIGISGGNLTLSTDDDGIHADEQIVVDGGLINILNCNEGVESLVIIINDGDIRLRASDDGFNASDGNTSVTNMGVMPGKEVATEGCALYINGGYIYVSSNGDSVDSNGNIYMTGGTLVVNGPESFTNGALDSDGEFEISGGIIVAAGSSGMAESPDETSDQPSLLYLYETEQSAGTMIYIESEDGEQILAFEPTKNYQSIVISSPELSIGKKYTIYSGGSVDTSQTDGLYENGTYSKGIQVDRFELTGNLTVIGTQSRQAPGGPAGGPGAGGRP